MNLEQSLYARLAAYSGLAALVSTRIYPVLLPQEPTLEAVTYQRINTPTDMTMSGDNARNPRFQVTAWAETYAEAKAVAAQIVACLEGFAGELGGSGGVQTTISMLNQIDLVDPDTGWYYTVTDFALWHNA